MKDEKDERDKGKKREEKKCKSKVRRRSSGSVGTVFREWGRERIRCCVYCGLLMP